MKDSAAGLARANLYRYLSVAPLPPTDPRFAELGDPGFQSIVTAAIEWLREDPALHPAAFGPGELDPWGFEPGSMFPDGDDLSIPYLEVFGHSISKDCPPYENEYTTNSDVTFRSQRLADIAGFYRAFGLDRSASAHDRVDHLSFEAEFVEILIARELYAIENGLGDSARDVCRSAQRSFFVEHLGWWLPAFGVKLEARTDCRFYRGLARFVRVFAATERQALDVPPFTELPVAHLEAFEPEGSCFGCDLGSGAEDALTPLGGTLLSSAGATIPRP